MNRVILVIVAVISVALVAGAVFMGARLLNRPDEGGSSGGKEVMMVGADGGAGSVATSFDLKPAAELPDTPPEVAGLFVRREDNSIFVGTGEIEISMTIDKQGDQPQVNGSYNGPVLEVVVTRETIIYRDETKMPSPDTTSGELSIQQVVTPVGSLEDLGENTQNTEIQIWGRRSGDRVVAEVLVYRTLGG